MNPREVPEFLVAFDRAGPVRGHDRITVAGVWTSSREAASTRPITTAIRRDGGPATSHPIGARHL